MPHKLRGPAQQVLVGEKDQRQTPPDAALPALKPERPGEAKRSGGFGKLGEQSDRLSPASGSNEALLTP